ncbi:hypothetical protein KKF84_01245, partial [Myxococcota bacterium]|nr:hypothetical protein [Myxococcota bacterium]
LEIGSTEPALCGVLANGQGGMANDSGYDSGGGGGGSGGAIILEAPRIHIYMGAVVAANGGGGAAGRESTSHGSPGLSSDEPAPGGSCGSCNTGGAGGAAVNAVPENGYNNEDGDGTGGGGGATGRVVIHDCLEFLSGGTYSPLPNLAGCHLP